MTTTLPPPTDNPTAPDGAVDVATPTGLSIALIALAVRVGVYRLPTPIDVTFGLLPDVAPEPDGTGLEVYCRTAADVDAWATALRLPPAALLGQAIRCASGDTWRRYETRGAVTGVPVRVWAPAGSAVVR